MQPRDPEAMHNTDTPFTIGDNNDATGGEAFEGNSEEATQWQRREFGRAGDQDDDDGRGKQKAVYGSFAEERDVWSK